MIGDNECQIIKYLKKDTSCLQVLAYCLENVHVLLYEQRDGQSAFLF